MKIILEYELYLNTSQGRGRVNNFSTSSVKVLFPISFQDSFYDNRIRSTEETDFQNSYKL